MPFAQINCFNHTDPCNKTTSQKDLPNLNNEFWDTSRKDRIISIVRTKGADLKPTENTKYGRSETREMDPKTGNKAAAKIGQYKGSVIAVRQAIFDLGPDGKAIGLQWHGSSTRPLVKGQWLYDKETDTYYLNVQLAETFKAKEKPFILVKGVKRGQIYDLAFGFNKDTFVAGFNWKSNNPIIKTVKINQDGSYSEDKGLYAKWGLYCQTDIKLPVKEQKDGTAIMAHFECALYHGDTLDLDIIDLDEGAFWRVNEQFDLDAPERFQLPPLKPTAPEKPTTPVPPSPTDGSSPAPSTPATPATPENTDELFKDVPQAKLASVQKLVKQIQGNIENGAKKTAKDNLSKLEDTLDNLDDSEGKALRAWCNEQRDAVK
jgi:hypothetical protein